MKVIALGRCSSLLIALALGGGYCLLSAQDTAAPSAGESKDYRALLDKYCVGCHSDKLKTGGLTLQSADISNPTTRPDIWEKVVRKLRAGAMPPQGMPQPGRANEDQFAGWLENILDHQYAANPRPGRPLVHRLNRAEYANSVRDLLGVDIDVESLLPSDASSFGFDNNADTLTVSPVLLEKYLSAADKIGDLALGNPKAKPVSARFPIKFDFSQNQRMPGMALGTSGGAAIKYNFPADGEYTLSGRLYEAHNSSDRGEMGEDVPTYFEITVDGKRVLLAHFGGKDEEWTTYKAYMGARDDIASRMSTKTFIKAGVHTVSFGFIDRKIHEDGVQLLYRPAPRSEVEGSEAGGPAQLENVTIDGPYNPTGVSETASRDKILICQPTTKASEVPCARKILTTLASRAYRRPATDDDVEKLLSYYQRGRNRGSFDQGIKLAISRILTSTSFVFRTEVDPPGISANGTYRISDLELASRLSFFLWSSIPDDELRNLAAQGKLKDPAVLDQQVRRMLADSRAEAFVSNFTGQWLGLRAAPQTTPDPLVFHDFDDQIRTAMRRETELLFESVMREDRNIFDLLNADYTFVNERLAAHYGIKGISGEEFRRVPVTDENRRGLIGQASLLTMSSSPTRTSPVKRGKWILSTILNIPPPPPPPNVDTNLKPDPPGQTLTMRERMQVHRANPFCAGCHRTIDPVGFSLENFNPTGQWRGNNEDGKPVDASGTLWDGTQVNSPADLRKAIMNRSDLFLSTVTERMMTYAFGRGLEYYEMPVLREVDREAAKHDYRFSSIVLGIVNSVPFRMRSGPGSDEVQSAGISSPESSAAKAGGQ